MKRACYILLLNLALALVVSSAQAAPTILSVEAGRIGNTGSVSFVVNGTGFEDAVQFQVVDVRSGVHVATKQSVLSYSKAIATFDLTGAPTGAATVAVKLATTTASLPNAITIETGVPGKLLLRVDSPAKVRGGELSVLHVVYGNEGGSDLSIPLLLFKVPGASFVSTEADGKNLGERVQIVGFPQSPFYSTLRPGELVNLAFYVKVSSATDASVVATSTNNSALTSAVFDYSQVTSGISGTSSASAQAYIQDLKDEYGANLSEYYQKQIARADTLVNEKAGAIYKSISLVGGKWKFEEKEPNGFKPRDLVLKEPVQKSDPRLAIEPTYVSRSGDGVEKVWVVIVADSEYSEIDRKVLVNTTQEKKVVLGDNSYAYNDRVKVYHTFHDVLGVPDKQIRVLYDTENDGYTLTKERVALGIKSLRSTYGADGDDRVVVWYSGHGLPKYRNGKYPSGSWVLNEGDVFTAADLKEALEYVGAGSNYVFSDSCYSGDFVSDLDISNTAAFAASAVDQPAWSADTPDSGIFTYYMTQALQTYKPLSEVFSQVQKMTAKGTLCWARARQNPMCSLNLATPDRYGINLSFPFGVPRAQSEEIQRASQELWEYTPTESDSRASRSVGILDDLVAPSYQPGGVAACPWNNIVFVSDATNGRILMVDPYSGSPKITTLLSGLKNPGDLDLAYQAKGLVYTDDNKVKRVGFGLSAQVLDSAGSPAAGAEVLIQTDLGEFWQKTDQNGQFNALNIISNNLASYKASASVKYQGKTELFSFYLDQTCQTIEVLRLRDEPILHDGEVEILEPDPSPIPPEPNPAPPGTIPYNGLFVEEPEPPVTPLPLTISKGETSLSTPQSLDENSSNAVGGIIRIITPIDGLRTDSTVALLNGVVTESTVSAVKLVVNGASQDVTVENGSFDAEVLLADGVNTIQAVATLASGKSLESNTVKVNFDASAPQEGAVVGNVFSMRSGLPISGKKVTELTSGRSTYTDKYGFYGFTGLASGTANIKVGE